MINYFCPDFIEGLSIYKRIIDIQEKFPKMCYDDSKIHTVFGNVTNLTWNGGSEYFGSRISIEELDLTLNEYKKMGINIQFTMTNPLLENFDIYDRMGNEILTMLAELYSDMVEILVVSPYLEEHIRNVYPELKISKSIIAMKNDSDFLDIDLDKYEHIVLPIRCNENFDFLEEYSKNKREKVEILCNDPCTIDCPRLYTHYNVFAERTLYHHCKEPVKCTNDKATFSRMDYPISRDRIKKEYEPLGYTNFKLSGRCNPLNIVTSVIPYFFKPEYHLTIVRELLA